MTRAAARRADDAELHTRKAITLQDLGRVDEALASYEAAVAVQPDYALALFHRGLARLLKGDYCVGWPDYEYRLVSADLALRRDAYPRWRGTSLTGRSILVYGEQGLGDEIMFASCLPQVINSAKHCTIECSPKLVGLFKRSFPDATVYAIDPISSAQAARARQFDFEAPIGSLPLYHRRNAGDFPQHNGYLVPDTQKVQHWRHQLEQLGPTVKVGISWRGGTHQSRSALRCVNLDHWEPLLSIPGVSFVSLQYTAEAATEVQMIRDRGHAQVVHWHEAIAEYEDTAALVCALDLTISVCTAAIHLAGALGQPVWIMAPRAPEWRYGEAGDSMPWYPSARVFRQVSAGEWEPVIQNVAAALREHLVTKDGMSP